MMSCPVTVNRDEHSAHETCPILTASGPSPTMFHMTRAAAYRYYVYFTTPSPGRWSRTR